LSISEKKKFFIDNLSDIGHNILQIIYTNPPFHQSIGDNRITWGNFFLLCEVQ